MALSRSDASTTSVDLAKKMIDVLAERQADDIVLLDISKVCDFADYFVIATGTTPARARGAFRVS